MKIFSFQKLYSASFILAMFFLYFIYLPSSIAETKNIYASTDTFASEVMPDYNWDSSSSLNIGRDPDSTRFWIYIGCGNIKEQLPDGAIISNAKLRLYRISSNGTFSVGIQNVDTNWWSNLLTWNNRPNTYSPPETVQTATGSNNTYISFDVTQHVKKWVEEGLPNRGVCLRQQSDCAAGETALFASVETNETLHRPRLEIEYTSRPPQVSNPDPTMGATGVSINTDLHWASASGATSYDVYFGTDSTPDSGEYQANQNYTSYDLGTLNYSTTHTTGG